MQTGPLAKNDAETFFKDVSHGNSVSLKPDLSKMIAGAVAEVNPTQIAILRRLAPAERFRLGCSISDTARKVVVYRIRQRNPDLTQAEANRLALLPKRAK